MNILFFNWRDIKNPRAGGAEIYTHEVAKRLVEKGNNVTFFCASFPGAKSEEVIDGVKIIRRGKQWTVHWQAFRWYNYQLKTKIYKPDIIIDEINTIPFFTPFYIHPVKSDKVGARPVKLHNNISQGKQFNRVKKEKNIAYINQLAREVWWYEAKFPLNLFGYLLEPLYLKPYRKIPIITISNSTKEDLIKHGFKSNKINVVIPGIDFKPLDSLPEKEEEFTLIFVGRLNKSKRSDHAIKAFELINKKIPESKLWIVGEGEEKYKNKLKKLTKKLELENKVKFWGFVSENDKIKLMQKAHLILVTSVKEGWGIIVTEAAACGTPAVVYNVDGLRDSVKHNKTGIVCKENNPENLSDEVIKLLSNRVMYDKLQYNAWQDSKEFSWDKTADEFIKFTL